MPSYKPRHCDPALLISAIDKLSCKLLPSLTNALISAYISYAFKIGSFPVIKIALRIVFLFLSLKLPFGTPKQNILTILMLHS
jgi:hypothetical protein